MNKREVNVNPYHTNIGKTPSQIEEFTVLIEAEIQNTFKELQRLKEKLAPLIPQEEEAPQSSRDSEPLAKPLCPLAETLHKFHCDIGSIRVNIDDLYSKIQL